MAEYDEVLGRPMFQLPSAEVELVLAAIRARSFWAEAAPAHRLRSLPDPDDAPFLECALAAGAPLVTGNLRHFPKSAARDITVITPAQFVALFKHEAS
jgi:predicted nucleic acid-binding protein